VRIRNVTLGNTPVSIYAAESKAKGEKTSFCHTYRPEHDAIKINWSCATKKRKYNAKTTNSKRA